VNKQLNVCTLFDSHLWPIQSAIGARGFNVSTLALAQ
jgi:hypothetical protein